MKTFLYSISCMIFFVNFLNIVMVNFNEMLVFLNIQKESNNFFSFMYMCCLNMYEFVYWVCFDHVNILSEYFMSIYEFNLKILKWLSNIMYFMLMVILNCFLLLIQNVCKFLNFSYNINPNLSINLQVYNYLSLNLLILIFSFLIHVIFSMWARAAGPSVRIDQMSKLTWKDYIFAAVSIIFIVIFCSFV